jgi:lipoate-protein ligase B
MPKPMSTVEALGGRRYRRGVAAPRIERWGKVGYPQALQRQLALWQRRVDGEALDTIVEVEHPPTITLGRHAPDTDVITTPAELTRRGIELVRSDRGGRATVHGPGQVVIYPIVGIADLGVGVRTWVCDLEAALVDVLAECGIDGRRVDGKPGVWTANGKIASLGLRVARGVSYHGMSLNVGLDAGPFDCILACGVPGERITSVSREAPDAPTREQVARTLCHAVANKIEAYALH